MLNNMDMINQTLNQNIEISLKKTNLQQLFEELSKVKEPFICSGVGGSYPVALFASKVLQKKNKVEVHTMELLEILQRKEKIKNVLLISHSGKNYGIKRVIENISNVFLLTTRKTKIKKEKILPYVENVPEKSFISIFNTILPMSIFLAYYLDNDKILEIEQKQYELKNWNTIEVFTDYDSKACASYIESTCIESNLGPVIVHDKYSFCHGRTTFTHYNSSLILYLISKKTKFDDLLIQILKSQNKQIILFDAKEEDTILADYKLTRMALNLLIEMAKKKNIDLCNIKYAPFASKVYHYHLEDY